MRGLTPFPPPFSKGGGGGGLELPCHPPISLPMKSNIMIMCVATAEVCRSKYNFMVELEQWMLQ